ncbi:phage repressor protein CI [Erwinia sp. Leaf53]|uniref:phage repressor protein CI n=1 Tax=Erwinia sp. Leaf53 TaxID=1736225 RepID=UPI0009E8BC3D|nr:phage repressor protein CI [Erwinia sp. Leaf53]
MIDANFDNEALLNRICEVYGFTQKIQLANHFKIAASSLQNRYKRGNMSYDFAVLCSLETGASLNWLMTGEGHKDSSANEADTSTALPSFTLSDGILSNIGTINADNKFFSKPLRNAFCLKSGNKSYITEKDASLTDGLWVVDVEGAVSLRDLTVLPGKKLHVAGGKVPFECATDEIKMLGRVVGVYSEIN